MGLEGFQAACDIFPIFPKCQSGSSVDIGDMGVEPHLKLAKVVKTVFIGVTPAAMSSHSGFGIEIVGALPFVGQIVIVGIAGIGKIGAEKFGIDHRLEPSGSFPCDAGVVPRRVVVVKPCPALEQYFDVVAVAFLQQDRLALLGSCARK